MFVKVAASHQGDKKFSCANYPQKRNQPMAKLTLASVIVTWAKNLIRNRWKANERQEEQ